MQLSQKRKFFSQFFIAFCKLRFCFEHFEKKDDPHRSCIFEPKGSERRGYINV